MISPSSRPIPAIRDPSAARTLCFGGSFNPPHHGHLICARAAAERAGFSKVRLIVSARPPHKPGDLSVIDPAHRVAMCGVAVAGDPTFVVDDREARRAGPSFTADTARELRVGPSAGPVHWMIGADLLAGLPRWHEAARLLAGDLVRFVVVRRAGYSIDWDVLPPEVRALRDAVVDVPDIAISSTDVRDRVRRGFRRAIPRARLRRRLRPR